MDTRTRSFIEATFPSVWALELLLQVRRQPERGFSREELVELLRASDSVVMRSTEALIAAGVVVEEAGGSIRYAPASAAVDRKVAETEALYRTRPDAVRRLVVSASAGNLAAFADAFRLRGQSK